MEVHAHHQEPAIVSGSSVPLRAATYVKVRDLRPAAPSTENDEQISGANQQRYSRDYPNHKKLGGGFNLCLLIGKVDVVVDKYRVDRSRVRLAEVEVGDETGTVSLRARDHQIALIQEIAKETSGAIVIRNCSVELYQNKFLRLAVSKWGKISRHPDGVRTTPPPPREINRELNLSDMDFSGSTSLIMMLGGGDMGIAPRSGTPSAASSATSAAAPHGKHVHASSPSYSTSNSNHTDKMRSPRQQSSYHNAHMNVHGGGGRRSHQHQHHSSYQQQQHSSSGRVSRWHREHNNNNNRHYHRNQLDNQQHYHRQQQQQQQQQQYMRMNMNMNALYGTATGAEQQQLVAVAHPMAPPPPLGWHLPQAVVPPHSPVFAQHPHTHTHAARRGGYMPPAMSLDQMQQQQPMDASGGVVGMNMNMEQYYAAAAGHDVYRQYPSSSGGGVGNDNNVAQQHQQPQPPLFERPAQLQSQEEQQRVTNSTVSGTATADATNVVVAAADTTTTSSSSPSVTRPQSPSFGASAEQLQRQQHKGNNTVTRSYNNNNSSNKGGESIAIAAGDQFTIDEQQQQQQSRVNAAPSARGGTAMPLSPQLQAPPPVSFAPPAASLDAAGGYFSRMRVGDRPTSPFSTSSQASAIQMDPTANAFVPGGKGWDNQGMMHARHGHAYPPQMHPGSYAPYYPYNMGYASPQQLYGQNVYGPGTYHPAAVSSMQYSPMGVSQTNAENTSMDYRQSQGPPRQTGRGKTGIATTGKAHASAKTNSGHDDGKPALKMPDNS